MKYFGILLFLYYTVSAQTQGNYDWAVNPAQLNGNAVLTSVDQFGNSFVVFSTLGSASTPSIIATAGPCVARYNQYGQLIWAKNLTNMPSAICADSEGNLFLVGTTIQNEGYLQKMDYAGNLILHKIYNKYTRIYSLTVAVSGDVFFAGEQSDTLNIDTISIVGSGIFVARCDKDGVAKWVTSGTVIPSAYKAEDPRQIAVDTIGNVYTAYKISTCDNWSCLSGWLLKLDANGAYVFHKNINGYSGSCHGILIEPDGHIIMNMTSAAGTSYGAYDLRKYNPDMSAIIWTKQVASWQCQNLFMSSRPVRAPDGSIFVAGTVGYQCGKYVTKVAFGLDTVTCDSLPDFVVARFNGQTGAHQGVWHAPAPADEMVLALAADKFGNIYAGGYYNSSSVCFGPHCLTASQPNQCFFFKLKLSNSVFTDNVGISEYNKSYYVGPNPTSGIIKIQADNTIEQCTLYNLDGMRMWAGKIHDGYIDISVLQNGVYLLQIGKPDSAQFRKVIISH